MNSGIFLGLFVTLWALLALTDAQAIQLDPGTIGSGVAGILRVHHNGEWGTVCDDGFDMNDAMVACRQLGFTKAVGYWYKGRGSGKVWLEEVACKGSESSLHDCSHPEWGKMDAGCKSHAEDVGVVCSGYKGPPQDNIQFQPGTTGSAVAGIIQVYHKNDWGTVCHSFFDMYDAKVACRQLGFIKTVGPMDSRKGSGKVWLNGMACTGTEFSLQNCSHGGWGGHDSACGSHKYDAGVVCSGYKVRLSGGVNEGRDGNPIEGRVEVMYSGKWGAICDDGWGMKESNVLCRMLGHEKAVKIKHFNPAQASRKTWLRDISCKGCETSIEECRHPYFKDYRTACNTIQRKVVGVVCKPKGNSDVKVTLDSAAKAGARGRVEIEYHGIVRPICANHWDIGDANVICKMRGFSGAALATKVPKGKSDRVWLSDIDCTGNEKRIEDCRNIILNWGNVHCKNDLRAGVVCIGSKTDINVVFSLDEKTNGSGVVKAHVEYYNVTGNVCANNFQINDARVLCRHLGYNEAVNLSPWTKESEINFAISMNCNGKENYPKECIDFSIRQVANCDNGEIIGLVCRNESGPTKLTSDDITLVNGSNKGEGRVQIKQNGMNGTICSDGWDMIDANVLCKMKGFAGAITAYKNFGKGSGPVWFTEIKCIGKEVNLEHCKPEKTTECSHRRDAGVVCYSDRDITGQLEVELASTDHDSSHYGRVQIIFNNTLRTICGDEDWDINDAHVVCRMLHYRRALASIRQYGKRSNGPSLSNVRCKGYEKSLDKCDHRGWDHLTCSEGFDAGVICEKIIDEAPYILVDVIKDITENTARIVFGSKRQYKKRIFQIAVQQITSKKRLSSNDFRQDSFEFLQVNATTSKAIGNDSYMAAEIVNPKNFTIGDGRYYNGYYNAPLQPKTAYRVHVRTITIRHGNKVYGKSSHVTFTTKSEYPKASPLVEESDGSGTIVGLSMIIVILIGVIIGMSVWYVLKKRKEKQSTESNTQALEMENAGNLGTIKDNAHGNTKAFNQEENKYHVIVDQDDESRALQA